MRHIETEIVIDAPATSVWEVMMNFDDYGNWNPFMKSISGQKEVGQKLSVEIYPPEGKKMAFQPTITSLEANKELKWLGTAPIRGIFDGEHYFRLEELDGGKTKFHHGEKFSGLMVGLMKKTLDKTEEGFK